MSEHRRDPISGRWVVIAPERARSASDFVRPRPPAEPGPCAFCPGQEGEAPHEIRALRGDGGWRARVVPSRVPVMRVEESGERRARGVHVNAPGLGAHEVVVETPRHGVAFSELTEAEVTDVLAIWQERLRDLSHDTRMRTAMVCRNEGEAFGRAPAHAHSQVVASPILPAEREHELTIARQVHESRDACLACEVLRQELDERRRIVESSEAAVAYAPWASRVPFETWIVPTGHEARFEREPAPRLAQVAQLLLSTARRLDAVLDRPSWQLVLQTAPLREPPAAHGHWRVELMPALAPRSALEWGGLHVNPVAPETAAEWLRTA